MTFNFASDNTAGVSPEIAAAMVEGSRGSAMPYGNDPVTQELQAQFSQYFETEVEIFPVATGSAANALALSVLSPPYGAIYCHQNSHINMDECGAPEFFTNGAKLVCIDGASGKIHPEDLADWLGRSEKGSVHAVQPAAVSITQATEAGTVYSLEEIRNLAAIAHAHDLPLHMDGARFANAVVSLGCTPAEMTWRAGVDVLSFGATKNGCWAAEAIVFFRPDLAKDLLFRRKRGGHLISKMRFVSLQLQAYLTGNLWHKNAEQANRMAAKLATGLGEIPGVEFEHPTQANELFVHLPEPVLQGLKAAGFQFYRWAGEESQLVRLVTSFEMSEESVDQFLVVAQTHAAQPIP
ncbi:low specificity L-threonine aldolase [filamentous cyanobacterium CCP5]|nr:low specificity L-threonine aldolase [filamentous cyanobacterium CCP5]